MGKVVKGIVGLSFAAYCAVSAVWLGKNMNYMSKLGNMLDDDKDDKPAKRRKVVKTKPPKYFTVVPKRDDDEDSE